jgi:LysM repeat protein
MEPSFGSVSWGLGMSERTIFSLAFALGLSLGGITSPVSAADLRGSMASVQKQYHAAMDLGFTPAHNTTELAKWVGQGTLIRVPGNENYELGAVSFPYTRATTKAFIECFAKEYRAATGEKLVVTSLTRPLSRQPANASDYSVHPMGMAVDFRRSNSPATRRWMERRLASLEATGIIEATHEHRPPHYHVAVFPPQVASYASAYLPNRTVSDPVLTQASEVADASTEAIPAVVAPTPIPIRVSAGLGEAAQQRREASATRSVVRSASSPYKAYRVSRGDTLWVIASKFDTSVRRIRKLNGLKTSRIYPGQKLMVPGGIPS